MRCFLFLVLSLSLLSCNNDDDRQDCSLVDCVTNEWYLDIVSSTTGDNLFENETLDKEEISVINITKDNDVPFLVFDNLLIIALDNFTNTFTEVSYQIKHKGQLLFTLPLESKREILKNQCCPVVTVRNISFGNTKTENSNEGVYDYRVFLDL